MLQRAGSCRVGGAPRNSPSSSALTDWQLRRMDSCNNSFYLTLFDRPPFPASSTPPRRPRARNAWRTGPFDTCSRPQNSEAPFCKHGAHLLAASPSLTEGEGPIFTADFDFLQNLDLGTLLDVGRLAAGARSAFLPTGSRVVIQRPQSGMVDLPVGIESRTIAAKTGSGSPTRCGPMLRGEKRPARPSVSRVLFFEIEETLS